MFGASRAHSAAPMPLKDNWRFAFTGNDSVFAHADSPTRYSSEIVSIPHIFPRNGPERAPARGIGWYFREVDIPGSSGESDVFLDFEGVCLRAKVFVDGAFAGRCDLAYMPFTINLTGLVLGKTRVNLAVMVDNRALSRQIPDDRAKGWWMHGGMLRESRLRFRSVHRIEDASIRTTHHDSDTFDIHLSLRRASMAWDSVTLVINRFNDRKVPVFQAAMTGMDTVFHLGGIRPWSPESAFRYVFSMVPFFRGKAGDTLTITRGFCQMSARNGRLQLNGIPYYLKGMARHDIIGGDERPPTREERLRDLLELKSLGVNFLRIAHFPQHRDVYELCDSLGLLVMDEIPAWKTDPRFLGSREGREFGARYLERLIEAHGNYTCICLWSLGNQFASYKNSVADYVRTVSDTAKRTDPSRLVTFCSCYYSWDKAFSYVDVISVNEYFGWELASLGMLPAMLDNIHKDWPGKPVLVSEVGAQAKSGLRNPAPKLSGFVKSLIVKDLSEDHQALFLAAHLDTIWNKRGFVDGAVVWSYADYRSYLNKARTSDMPAGLNACGVVTNDRKKKLSYDVVKQRYCAFRGRFTATP
jgi:hypothetical protein